MIAPPIVAGIFARLALMPLAYWLLWCGSLALSAVLVALLRTRWGQSRPLQKCAVLSLLVHLLLAWAAMTVHMVAGDGGGGFGPSIRVRLVQDSGTVPKIASFQPDIVTEDAPPLLEPPKEAPEPPKPAEPQLSETEPPKETVPSEPVVAKSEPEPPKASETADQQTLPDEKVLAELHEPEPAVEMTQVDENNETASKQAAEASQSAAENLVVSARTPVTSEAPVAIATPTVAAPASQYAQRTAPGRLGLVERQGGNAQTEAAVAAALQWLASAQSPDGRWEAVRFDAGQEQMVLGHNRGGAGRGADTGISALALLAFLGAGHSHQQGEYQDIVRRGLDFLLRSQRSDGSLFGGATFYAQMYCHSMATFALAEAQAMTGDGRIQPAVEKAISFCIASQNSATGGWRYRPGDTGDTSQLGWQMMALASAEQAGVAIPSHTWDRVERFLGSVRHGAYGGLASYRPESGPSTSMTAEALYCRLLLSGVTHATLADSAANEATTQVLAALPDAKRVNLYYWYYASLALHHRQHANAEASAAWYAWSDALTGALLATQTSDGADAGSWNTNTVWGGYGGRVYTTAMAAMCLEVYYRYAPPAPQDRWTATRSDSRDDVR